MKNTNLDIFRENNYFPCLPFTVEKALFKIIFWHKIFICEPIFKNFVVVFKTFGIPNGDNHYFLEVFQNSEILKKAVPKNKATS